MFVNELSFSVVCELFSFGIKVVGLSDYLHQSTVGVWSRR